MKKFMASAAQAANEQVADATIKNHTNPAETGGLPGKTLRYLDVVKVQGLNEGLQMADAEDRRSHALYRAVKALPSYRDGGPASKATYLHAVIDNSVKDSKRAAGRMKRSNETLTLDMPVSETNGFEGDDRMVDLVADEDDGGFARTDMKMDVQSVLFRLTPVQRKVCGLLMSGVLKRDVPARAGITEHEFKHKVMPALAKTFAELRAA